MPRVSGEAGQHRISQSACGQDVEQAGRRRWCWSQGATGSAVRRTPTDAHAQHLQQRRDVAADRAHADDHRALALEIARRALAQPRLPGMAALGVGQQREAPVDRDQRAQHAVRHRHRGGARGRRHLHAAPAQLAIDRPLGAGRMDLQPAQPRRLAQHRLEAAELGRRIVLARLAGDLAGHEGDVDRRRGRRPPAPARRSRRTGRRRPPRCGRPRCAGRSRRAEASWHVAIYTSAPRAPHPRCAADSGPAGRRDAGGEQRVAHGGRGAGDEHAHLVAAAPCGRCRR